MLKSTIAAAVRTTAFTILIVGAVSMTGEQALAAKDIPVSADRAARLVEQCMLRKGTSLDLIGSGTGSTFTLGCCAVNSEGTKWCVVCNGGTLKNPTDCEVVSSARTRLLGSKIPKPGLSTRPSGSQLAPTKKKQKIPPIMGKFQKAPTANAPTEDKPKSRPYLNKLKKR